jgi:hypothetical protein
VEAKPVDAQAAGSARARAATVMRVRRRVMVRYVNLEIRKNK